MRLANLDGRATLVQAEDSGVDVETASQGKFGPDLPAVYEEWEAFTAWASSAASSEARVTVDRARLGPPSPAPRQIFGIGLNYSDHAREAGLPLPEGLPPVFTKFVTSLTGPDTTVVLPAGGHTDWEVELVVVVGRLASRVPAAQAWDHVAGVCVGQDLSERIAQLAGPVPQFSFGKSLAGFSPTGPWLVTPDELADRDDLEIGCAIDGEVVQQARTATFVADVPTLVAGLSAGVTLLPGDLIFTGTPGGVGLGRSPQRWLAPGEELRSWVSGVGEIRQRFVADPRATSSTA